MLARYNLGDEVYYLVSCFSMSFGRVTGIKAVPRDDEYGIPAHIEYSINGGQWMSENSICKNAEDLLNKFKIKSKGEKKG